MVSTHTSSVHPFIGQLHLDIANNRLILPALPQVTLQIREMINDPNLNFHKLSQLISSDQGLAGRVLKVANSALFNPFGKIESINKAIKVLGVQSVRNLVYSFSLIRIFNSEQMRAIQQPLTALWQHTSLTAATAQVLANKFSTISPATAMLAGLLSRIGTLPILSLYASKPELLSSHESIEHFIIDQQAMVGGIVLYEWNFPDELALIPSQHLNSHGNSSGPLTLCDLICIANLYSQTTTGYLQPKHLINESWQLQPAFLKLNINTNDVEKLFAELEQDISNAQQFISNAG